MNEPKTILTGDILEIIYQNEANSYTVCVLDTDTDPVTCVGYLPFLTIGEHIAVTGEWTVHPDYGEQFKIQSFEKILPTTVQSILRYLSSGIIKGVKLATAQKIVDKFGEQALDIMLNQHELLSQIRGISKAKAEQIHLSFLERQSVQRTVMFLQQYGVTAEFAMKVHQHFGICAVERIQENPYVLCEEISGIGFRTADRIASAMGIFPTHEGRLKNGIQYVLLEAVGRGHTFLPKSLLMEAAENVLSVTIDYIENAMTALLLENRLGQEPAPDEPHIYLLPYQIAETNSASRLLTLNEYSYEKESHTFEALFRKATEEAKITLSEQQKFAVESAVKNGVTVITGGPGTGKTTIINIIIQIFQAMDLSIALAAPTGRAAKRMSECTGMDAKTIHRLLEMDYSSDTEPHFVKNESDPLNYEAVIIDEMSMVDIQLFYSLLRAIRGGTRLILVGDADQLPSVGAGNVLKDIIESGAVPVARLTEIYRQAEESMIVQNAHRIHHGKSLILNQKDNDFFFLPRMTPDDVVHTITELCEVRLKKAYGYDPKTDIQVLTPVRKNQIGVIHLNQELQKRLNPPERNKKEHIYRDTIFREGDKVMQIRNDYDLYWHKSTGEEGLGMFNGDVGRVTSIDSENHLLTVLFDDEKQVEYEWSQLDELELAYAITVHKSQGSEFPVVIIPLHNMPRQLITRNLFYTAVSRAQKLVVLVGRQEIIQAMIENDNVQHRYSGFSQKLQEGVPFV